MASLKKNVLLNFLNIFTKIVFPFVTFPYATRVLGLEGVGLTNFYASLINYIILFSGIGIEMYAAKEVARYRDNVVMRDQRTVEIALLTFVSAIVGYVAVALLCIFVPAINVHLDLFLILSLSIFFTVIGAEWFYRAIEDFTFITIRAVVIRILSAISLFVFVHSSDDLLAYCLITVFLSVGNNFVNFVHLRKYLNWRTVEWRKLHIWKHVLPSLKIFIPNLVTNFYGQLNIVMLGFMGTVSVVGIYTAGCKLVVNVLMVIVSLSLVLLPRCSNLIGTGQFESFAVVSRKSITMLVACALPCMAGLMLLCRPLILLFCGKAFSEASIVVLLTAPTLLLTGLSNFIGIQILYPQGKENIVVGSMLGGVILNVLLNFMFVPQMSYIGASVAALISEFAVLLIQLLFGRKFIPFTWRALKVSNYVFATFIMCLAVGLIVSYIHTPWLVMLIACLAGGGIYFAVLILCKDAMLLDVLSYVHAFMRKKHSTLT